MTTQHTDMAPRPHLGRYEIDTDASTVFFQTRHLFGLAPVRGSFTLRAGTVDVAEPATDSAVRVTIDAASFHTGTALRDSTVRSTQYLDTERYPVMSFTSDSWDGSTLAGMLTVRDVTRPVRLVVGDHAVWAGVFIVRATTRIDRTEFGVTAGRGITGRHLTVSMEVRCVRT